MRKIVFILMVLASLFMPVFVFGETIAWENPTEYVDGTPLSEQERGQLRTHLYWSLSSGGPWTEFAVVGNGANSWTGKLPASKGAVAYYTAKSELNSLLSDYAEVVSYTVPFVPTKKPGGLTISP